MNLLIYLKSDYNGIVDCFGNCLFLKDYKTCVSRFKLKYGKSCKGIRTEYYNYLKNKL